MIEKLRLAMLISGGGTTMREILGATRDGRLPRIKPALVIASTHEAGGIKKAHDWGMDTDRVVVISRSDYEDPRAFGEAILRVCETNSVEVVGQYGWMPKTPANLIARYPLQMINQHPGPLDPGRPDFGGKGMYGRRVHAARLWFVRTTEREFWTEATAQRVHSSYDQGPVLRSERVPILNNDSPIELQERVLPVEHRVQIEALRDLCEGRMMKITLDQPLVRPGEEPILTEAKKIAARLFPKG